MKLIFVDAENIGLRQLEGIQSAFQGRVFVFTKENSVKEFCEGRAFSVMSSYSAGSNQADFYIIAKLVSLIGSAHADVSKGIEFVLFAV
jgi:hypothetical protein